MNSDVINSLARATLEGSLSFPKIVGELIQQGVEYYHVDYAANSFTFYSASGATTSAPLLLDEPASISSDWHVDALKAAIIDSQQHGQAFPEFCRRAMLAGVQGYFAFLRGQRVTYLGRNGDQHIEWFPGVKADDS